jgi:hypothetical protein
MAKIVSFEIVSMERVPDPPVTDYSGGRYAPVWEAIKKAGRGETHAVRVACAGKKDLSYMRTQLRVKAKRAGMVLLSSRNAENTLAWFWLAPGDNGKTR